VVCFDNINYTVHFHCCCSWRALTRMYFFNIDIKIWSTCQSVFSLVWSEFSVKPLILISKNQGFVNWERRSGFYLTELSVEVLECLVTIQKKNQIVLDKPSCRSNLVVSCFCQLHVRAIRDKMCTALHYGMLNIS
jgi:hypothetical protein